MTLRKISIAPMMACTDRHYRAFMRIMTKHTWLYSEMVTTGAVLYGDRQKLLHFSRIEHPIALQLGGSEPHDLALSAKIAEDFGYDEVNLNVGCPSDRVQSGQFGACLLKQPDLVADCIAAMRQAVSIPVTVKTRIGVDDQDSYPELQHFIRTVTAAGCRTFIIHARKAWLKGLSPRENRNIPPLCYDTVYQLKRDFPALEILINGGIKRITDIEEHLQYVDGAMIGRAAYANPYLFIDVDQQFYGNCQSRLSQALVVREYLPYIADQLSRGIRLRPLIRHLIGLFQGMPGAKRWRRYLSENASNQTLGLGIVEKALQFVE